VTELDDVLAERAAGELAGELQYGEAELLVGEVLFHYALAVGAILLLAGDRFAANFTCHGAFMT